MEALNDKKLPIATMAVQDYKTEAVSVTISHGYDHKINILVVPATEIAIRPEKKCVPRKDADRRDARPLDLPPDFIRNFPEINKKMMGWLTSDAGNAHLFLQKPVESMLKAGIKLSREDQKQLSRNVEEIKAMAMIPPGARVTHFTAGTHKGKVTKEPEKKSGKDKSSEKDCGCS
jgi:hypothetical protein